jgi:hypothetical protein
LNEGEEEDDEESLGVDLEFLGRRLLIRHIDNKQYINSLVFQFYIITSRTYYFIAIQTAV